jgi:hypothetical protein
VQALGVTQLSTTLRGKLSGTIKNMTGAALPGMTVTARVNGGGQGQITTTSAGDGSWAFTGLDVAAGRRYSVSFRDPSGSYLPLDHDADPSTPGVHEMVTVVAGQTTTADAVMRRSSTLSGTVKNTDGAALPGMLVTARLNGGSQDTLTTTSAADGSWAFTGLDVGADRLYSLSVSDPPGSYLPLDYDADPSTTDTQDMVKVVAGQTSTADTVMLRSCTLSGVVTDSRTKQPVAGVQVEPVLAPGQPPETRTHPTSSGVTDATGAYAVTGIPQGVYVVACDGKPPVYGMQYWPAAATAEGAAQIALTPTSATAVADVVLHHDDTRPTTAALNNVKMRMRSTAKLKFRVTDAYGDSATLTLVVATIKGKVKARVKLGTRAINVTDTAKWRPSGFAPGKYTWWVTATDLAGNAHSRIVKKALALTR